MHTDGRLIAEAVRANQALGAGGQSDMVWGTRRSATPRAAGSG
jgi:hypothetical protein